MMGRPRADIPRYRLYLSRYCGIVVVAGQTVYFPGRYNSPESLAAYRAWLSEYLATGQIKPTEDREPTIGELVLAFFEQVVERRYVKNGRPTSEQGSYRLALKIVCQSFEKFPVSSFGPRELKQCREKMVEEGWTRKHVNQQVGRIKRCFRWAVSEGLAHESTWRALTSVEGLRFGEARAESRKVLAVPEIRVDAIKPYVTPPVWAVIQLQLWTGARPGEILAMRTCDIHADDPDLPAEIRGLCWVYRPASHKTEHHDRSRIILLGPQARAIVEPWLRPAEPEASLFCPSEARDWYLARKRGTGKAPRKKLVRKPAPKRAAGPSYTIHSYGRSVTRGCELAFGMPAELRRIPKAPPKDDPRHRERAAERLRLLRLAAEWRAKHCWHPHQLRHTAATKIRRAYGIEVARIILGHSQIATTEIYAEADLIKAAQAMAEMG